MWAATPALAHRVNVFAYEEGGKLVGEGYFAGGVKATGCKVELVNAKGKVLATATTDDKGRFTLPMPPPGQGPYKVLLHAGPGHMGSYTLTAEDLGQPTPEAQASSSPTAPQTAAPSSAAAQNCLDIKTLERVVGRVVDAKLGPVKAELARLSEPAVNVRDVLCGVGYILGLMGIGIWAYTRGKQAK